MAERAEGPFSGTDRAGLTGSVRGTHVLCAGAGKSGREGTRGAGAGEVPERVQLRPGPAWQNQLR